MQEHPVPQNVTGYEFHLIGQMTLKQFVECAVGVGIAVLINTTNLPQILKLPFMAIIGLGGFALAFLPMDGRSLDRWFFAFIRSIYQPTLFYWKKTNPTPEVFSYIQPTGIDTSAPVNYAPMRSKRVSEFLNTINQSAILTSPQGVIEEPDTLAVLQLFSEPINIPKTEAVIFGQIKTNPISIPQEEQQKIEVEKHDLAGEAAPTQIKTNQPIQVFEAVTSGQVKAGPADLKQTVTSQSLPFPKPPTKPNMIVGMVLSDKKQILDNAIVEIIRLSDQTPVRAIKTNGVGQFAIVTPLDNGEYEISVEKTGYSFDKTQLTLNNKVIEPILIQAKPS